MDTFVQSSSIFKKLTIAVVAVALLFMAEFLGIYLSSQGFIAGVAEIHGSQTLLSAVSLVRRNVSFLMEALEKTNEKFSKQPNIAALVDSKTVFSRTFEEAGKNLREVNHLSQGKSEYITLLGQVGNSLDQLNRFALQYYINFIESNSPVIERNKFTPQNTADALRRDFLRTKQFALEATEGLEKLRTKINQRSDHTFDDIYHTRYRPLLIAIVLTIGFVTLSLGLGYIFTKNLKHSINNLIHGTNELGRGNLNTEIPVISSDEVGRLTHAFNLMARNLRESTVSRRSLEKALEEVKKSRDQLEAVTRELEVKNVALIASNKELEAFSYSVSHDLRAPLRSADGFSKALMEEYFEKLDEQGKDYLNRIRAAAQRMGRLIDDLLNLSRISRKEMIIAKVNLSEIVEKIAEEYRKNEPERKVNVTIARDILVLGDEQLLKIVFENLFSNAWKFTSKKPIATLEFGVTKKEGNLVYFMRDDGAGFDMRYVQKLFGAFQRLHLASDFPGTGVGLATVQRIIHRHGGLIWAEAEVEKGATFYFTLPEEKKI